MSTDDLVIVPGSVEFQKIVGARPMSKGIHVNSTPCGPHFAILQCTSGRLKPFDRHFRFPPFGPDRVLRSFKGSRFQLCGPITISDAHLENALPQNKLEIRLFVSGRRGAMRLTILINGSDPTESHEYAVLWLDMEEGRWSREAHQGIDLPNGGEVSRADDIITLCEPAAKVPLCTLRGLRIDSRQQLRAAEGVAAWSSPTAPKSAHWRLQAVDREPYRAENRIFGD